MRIKSKGKNKAIQGRRNRVHQFGPIFQYDGYDREGYEKLKAALDGMKDGWLYLMIPHNIKVIYPPYKAPRFL